MSIVPMLAALIAVGALRKRPKTDFAPVTAREFLVIIVLVTIGTILILLTTQSG